MIKQSPNKITALQEIRTWSTDDVASLLRKNDLSECADLFKTMAMTGDVFMDLNESNLLKWRPELGFNKIRMLSRLLININKDPEHYVTYYTVKSKARRNYETIIPPGRKSSDPGAFRPPAVNSYQSQPIHPQRRHPSPVSEVRNLRSRMPSPTREVLNMPSRFQSSDAENVNVPAVFNIQPRRPIHAPEIGNVRSRSPAPTPEGSNLRPRYQPPNSEVLQIRSRPPAPELEVSNLPQQSLEVELDLDHQTNEDDDDNGSWATDFDGDEDGVIVDGSSDSDNKDDICYGNFGQDDETLPEYENYEDENSQNPKEEAKVDDLSQPPTPPRSNKPTVRQNTNNSLDSSKPSVPSRPANFALKLAFVDINNEQQSNFKGEHASPLLPQPPVSNPGSFSAVYFPTNLQNIEQGEEDYYESMELERGFRDQPAPNIPALPKATLWQGQQVPILDSPVPNMNTVFPNFNNILPKLPPSASKIPSNYHQDEQEYDIINEAPFPSSDDYYLTPNALPDTSANQVGTLGRVSPSPVTEVVDSRPVLPLPQLTQPPKEGVFKNLLPSFRSHVKPTFSGNKEISSPADMGGNKKPAPPPPSSPGNFSASKPSFSAPNVSSPESTMPISLNQRPLPAPPDTTSRPPGSHRAALAANNLQSAPWYHHLDRKRAEEALRALGNDGCFIVRPSSLTSNPLTLTLMFKGRFFNIPIRKRPDGLYALGTEKHNEQVYSSVEALIHNYFTEKLALYSCGENSGRISLTTTPPKKTQSRSAKPS